MTPCAQCADRAELEERIAWLESELGLQQETSHIATLTHAISSSMEGRRVTSGRPQAARFLLALYRAKGRVMSPLQIMEAVPPRDLARDDERIPKVVTVWAYFARCAVGKDAIQNSVGRGYRLTEAGMAKVAAILGQPSPIDPAEAVIIASRKLAGEAG